MAAKRAGKRKLTPGKAEELAEKARDDVQRLLKASEDGTVTREDLEAGLEEVAARLTDVMGFHYFKV